MDAGQEELGLSSWRVVPGSHRCSPRRCLWSWCQQCGSRASVGVSERAPTYPRMWCWTQTFRSRGSQAADLCSPAGVGEGPSAPGNGEGGPSHTYGGQLLAVHCAPWSLGEGCLPHPPRPEIHPPDVDPYVPSHQVAVNDHPFLLVHVNSLHSFLNGCLVSRLLAPSVYSGGSLECRREPALPWTWEGRLETCRTPGETWPE